MRAGLYARVSTTEQAKKGYSIKAQLEAMQRYCEAEGWTVAAEYTDEGFSGTTGDRPGLQAALADCEAGRVDVLLTHRLDRFYRHMGLQRNMMDQLKEWCMAYTSVSEGFDFTTPHGKVVAGVMGVLNEYFTDNLSREVKRGKEGRTEKGLSIASTLSYGYIHQEGRDLPEPDPEKASAVLLAFETYATGQHTDQEIADLLNQAGCASYQREWADREPVTHWTRSTVRKMLQNPFYVALVRYGQELHDGQHEAMISQELFDQAQAVRADRGQHVI